MLRPWIALGGGVAVVLVAVVALVASGNPATDLETEAMTPVSSRTVVSTATTPTTVIAPTTAPARELAQVSNAWNPPDVDEVPRTGNLTSQTTTTTTTTTTLPPPTTIAAPAGPEPVRIPRPSCAAGLGPEESIVAPFTAMTASVPIGLPAVVVKVSNNNSDSRRALVGLDQADIVFEERIEASATRFAAVFHSQLPTNVGPVRSGRTTDIQLLRNMGTPVLGYSGSNNGVAGQLSNAAANGWLVPVINTDRSPFARDSRYRAPDNLFVDPTSLGACGNGGTPAPIFTFGDTASAAAVPASTVVLQARSPFRFDWDETSGTWLRSQDGSPHVTRTGERLAPDNVVVMFVRYAQSAIDRSSVDAETVGTGEAWILRDGTITQGTWSRARPLRSYSLADATGAAATLRPGSTWVVLAPAGSADWS